MNTPVTFEIAKLLKEKDWATPTLNFYFEDGQIKENDLQNTVGMDYGSEFTVEFSELIENWNDKWLTKKNGGRCFGCSKSKGYFETFSAPTIAEAVMWLYEKHRIWCYTYTSGTYTNGKLWYPCIQYSSLGDMAVLSGKIGLSNSPIEAYEKAIEYTLKNLI